MIKRRMKIPAQGAAVLGTELSPVTAASPSPGPAGLSRWSLPPSILLLPTACLEKQRGEK